MRRIMISILFVLPFLVPGTAWPQNATTDSALTVTATSTQGTMLAGQALASLTSGVSIADVTLHGTATWLAGSDVRKGSVVLKARGSGQSRVDFDLEGWQRTEIRNTAGGFPDGAWIDPGGIAHGLSQHNCWADAVWFFPALSSLTSIYRTDVVISYVGHEKLEGMAVEHLRFSRVMAAKPKAAAEIGRLSTVDIYVDPASLLTVAIVFNAHPDDDGTADIPVKVLFSDYRVVNGVRIPFHIQKFMNGGLTLDIVIDSAVFNSGLPDSDFAVPVTEGDQP